MIAKLENVRKNKFMRKQIYEKLKNRTNNFVKCSITLLISIGEEKEHPTKFLVSFSNLS